MRIYWRTIIKGVLWEALGVLIMFIACYFLKVNYSIVGWYFFIRILIYYPFHRLLKQIKWDKVLEIKWKN